ncbi:MAG: hypothetical protein AB7O65_14265 [Candidatus Korobacteraceae bacterium]
MKSFTCCLVLLLGSTTLLGQEAQRQQDLCRDVLQLAFYDRAFDLESSHSEVAWTAWACTASDNDFQLAFDSKMKVPLLDANLLFAEGESKATSRRSWRETNCKEDTFQSRDDKLIWRERETVSRHMGTAIRAWAKCMADSSKATARRHFQVRIEPALNYAESGSFELRVSGERIVNVEPPALRFDIKGATCDELSGWISSDSLQGNQNSYRCRRTRIENTKQCPAGSTFRNGLQELSVDVDFAYYFHRRYWKPDRAHMALVPARESTCFCDLAPAIAPNFNSDPANCGSCAATCGDATGTQRGAQCSVGTCTKCVFQGPSVIQTGGSFPLSCKMKPNSTVRVSISGDIVMGPPDVNGNALAKETTTEIVLMGKTLKAEANVGGPGAQHYHPRVQATSTEEIQLDSEGTVNATLKMARCVWAHKLVPCKFDGGASMTDWGTGKPVIIQIEEVRARPGPNNAKP